ncbi:hypothetical protein [Brachybacterium sillae]|uniref:hypothetical protein n=1 Tax=Brachybacterium sillae TaxID=2810536 RepID=UPI0032E7FF95
MWITRVRPWGQESVDLRLDGECIAEVLAHDPARQIGSEDLDGEDRLLIPAFSDVHVHLDSTRLGLPFREHTGRPGVWGMMLNDRENWRDAGNPIAERVDHTSR